MSIKAIVIGLALAACSGKRSGTTPTAPPPAGGCDAVRGKVAELYRAEARAKEPTRIEDAVADNTRMVMLECTKTPDKISACIAGVTTVVDLERTCLAPLDDEGTEGDAFRN